MKPYTHSIFLVLIFVATLSLSVIPKLTESQSIISVRHLEKDPDQDDNPDKETKKLASPEFISNACNYTEDAATCKKVLESILGPNPKIEDTNPNVVAYKVVRLAQKMYGDVTVAVKFQIKDEDGNKDPLEVKKALSGCYKMYLDIVHQIRESMFHLGKRVNVCPATEFTAIAISNPQDCETQLERAGTNGQKLGLYKDYKDLVGVAETFKSVIGYLAHSQGGEVKCKLE